MQMKGLTRSMTILSERKYQIGLVGNIIILCLVIMITMVWYGIFIFQRQYKVIRKQN